MKNFIMLVIIFCGALLADTPQPSDSSCEYYQHLEALRPCSQHSNYLISYGYKYCSLFQTSKNDWSHQLQAWIENTTLCLQEKLADYQALNKNESNDEKYCENLEKIAFKSHADCYTEHGFCRLSCADQIRIASHLFQLDVLLKPKASLQQALLVAVRCSQHQVQSCNLL
ncbi:MAG: hypothetical protein KC505_07590 [Myxococcales bacterium]|nr:hypothetical protein [Myxococcales bacterium]USN51569.1 MAG: hypothetical protein H6731_03940 [Myxococcales bacterium]